MKAAPRRRRTVCSSRAFCRIVAEPALSARRRDCDPPETTRPEAVPAQPRPPARPCKKRAGPARRRVCADRVRPEARRTAVWRGVRLRGQRCRLPAILPDTAPALRAQGCASSASSAGRGAQGASSTGRFERRAGALGGHIEFGGLAVARHRIAGCAVARHHTETEGNGFTRRATDLHARPRSPALRPALPSHTN